MKAYSLEFRREVLAACDAGEGTMAVALRFNVSQVWVRRIKQQRRETGETAAKTAAPRRPKWRAWSAWLVEKIAADSDLYLRELQVDLKKERGEDVCLSTIGNACRALGLTLKKRRSSPRNKTDPT